MGWCRTSRKLISSPRENHNRIGKSLLIAAVVTSVLYGFAIINEKYLINELGVPSYLVFGWGAQATMSSVIALRLGLLRQMRLKEKSLHRYIWLLGILLPLSGVFFVMSIDASKSASLTVIGSSMKVIMTLVLAFILLKERERVLLKVVCVTVASGGLILLA